MATKRRTVDEVINEKANAFIEFVKEFPINFKKLSDGVYEIMDAANRLVIRVRTNEEGYKKLEYASESVYFEDININFTVHTQSRRTHFDGLMVLNGYRSIGIIDVEEDVIYNNPNLLNLTDAAVVWKLLETDPDIIIIA